MKTILLTLLIFLLFMILMGLGYLLARKALKGSCGGLGQALGLSCLFCSKRPEDCEKKKSSSS
ncbi:MAG: (Na+)-NQR maturation NqrM [Bacteriovoracales bacterium]|nr:(Na+)-NQR maturation NqrM [Bacteriovoracales bacterium]